MKRFFARLGRAWGELLAFGEEHGHHGYWLALVLLLAVLSVAIKALLFDPPRTLIAVTANTEIMEIIPQGTRQMGIALDGVAIKPDSKAQPDCVAGAFTPAPGSTVILARQGLGALTVQIKPSTEGRAGTFEALSHELHTYREAVTLTFDAKSGCKRIQPDAGVLRIPVTGVVTLGADFSPQTGPAAPPPLLLHSGRIETFTRAVDHLVLPLPEMAGALYPTGTVDLPPGARLRECASPENRVGWFGYAEVRGQGSDVTDRSMDVVLYTEARRLAITSPGGEKTGGVICETDAGGASGREDVLGVSVLARLVADPVIAIVAILLAAVSVILPSMIALHTLSVAKRPYAKAGRHPDGPGA